MTTLAATVLATGAGQASEIGGLVVLALIVVCVLLFRSLNTQLKRVPRSFDPQPQPARRPLRSPRRGRAAGPPPTPPDGAAADDQEPDRR